MPRDSVGTYRLPPGTPVVSGTTLVNLWANLLLADISTALTGSLSVDGSVTPAKLANDPAGFAAKLEVDTALASLNSKLDDLDALNAARIGVIKPFAMGTVQPSFLECNGAAVSRTTYAALFAKIGTTYGVGNGISTFNLPDLRAETVRGWDHGRGIDTDRVFGSAQAGQVPAHDHTATAADGGAHTHTGSAAAAGAHTHTATADMDGEHSHTFSASTGNDSAGHTHLATATTNTTGTHDHTMRAGSTQQRVTGSGSFQTDWDSFGSGPSTVDTSTDGAHTHTFAGTSGTQSANHTHDVSGTSDETGTHSHTLTVNDGGAHTHTLTTNEQAAHDHDITVTPTGGAENRVRNVAMMFCIKYQ